MTLTPSAAKLLKASCHDVTSPPPRTLFNGLFEVKTAGQRDLKRICNINSYIHDTPDFLRKLEDIKNQIPSTAIIGTFDVTSLYTNIPHAEGIAATCAALSKKVHPCPPISDIKVSCNRFSPKTTSRSWTSITFKDTGLPWEPGWLLPLHACLCLALKNACSVRLPVAPYLVALHDDIFFFGPVMRIACSPSSITSISTAIKFTSDYSHQQVNFLDVTVRKEHGSLSTDLYTKPMHRHTPVSPFFKLPSPSLQIDSNEPYLNKPIIAYRRPRNLRDLLVRTAVPPLTSNPTPIQHGTFKCDRTSRCIICSHHIVESNSITSHSMQLTHKTKGHITCKTLCIYLIACRVCGIQYVGETKTTPKKRFYGHRSTVNTMKTETPVGEHFNLPNHTISDMSLQGIESLGSRPDLVRISRERLWMQRLRDIQPHGLNIQEGHD
ncbi:hypothetical protein BSL78_08969 [Apostichopus japonicus]|uniref:GIY-YIG domain-containing protein n=1 Tax=Stichopus japonicus TaxID=307972 RepID=A0A2G8L1I4_STIJA|nr:hypothetical protein BSL78_08969 [Apostichopus japonicus]